MIQAYHQLRGQGSQETVMYRPINLSLIGAIIISGCIVLPKTVPPEDRECVLVTKSLTIDFYTDSDLIDEAVDEMFDAMASDCREPECLILLAPLITISIGSLIVSGSIVVVGNTIHWMEQQGKCDDSITQQALTGLKSSATEIGGRVIESGSELIGWFQKQVNPTEQNQGEPSR